MALDWESSQELESKSYACGYCGEKISSNKGYKAWHQNRVVAYIYTCYSCGGPTFLSETQQVPGPAFGQPVKYIQSKEVENLYNEARNCMKVNAFTAVALCLRKLLMNLAVSDGAGEGLSFIQYIDFLEKEGYVTPKNKAWVDHIRTMGNMATHEIRLVSKEEAQRLILFCEMLLKSNIEYPASLPTP